MKKSKEKRTSSAAEGCRTSATEGRKPKTNLPPWVAKVPNNKTFILD